MINWRCGSDPKKLLQAAFQVTSDQIQSAFQKSKVLQDAANDPRTKSALSACTSLMDSATDELKTSISQVGSLDITKIDKIAADLKVWLSAVVTYQETCMDSFENTTGNAAEEMRKALNASAQLSSNALAIVDDISEVLKSFDLPFLSRRLHLFVELGLKWEDIKSEITKNVNQVPDEDPHSIMKC